MLLSREANITFKSAAEINSFYAFGSPKCPRRQWRTKQGYKEGGKKGNSENTNKIAKWLLRQNWTAMSFSLTHCGGGLLLRIETSISE